MSEKDEQLFIGLLAGLHANAMQYLGKVANPLTEKIEKNLDMAKELIDLISILEEKTRGNLNEYEEKYLKNLLLELRMNFVEEVESEKETARQPSDENGEDKDDNGDENNSSSVDDKGQEEDK